MASAHIEHKLSLLPDLPGCYSVSYTHLTLPTN